MARASSPGIVDVWCGRVPDATVALEPLLHPLTAVERARADRFRMPDPRRRFVFGRYMLRSLLATYLGCGLQELVIAEEGNHKPVLATAGGPRFNLSHSEDLVVVAISLDRPVGIDAECLDPRIEWWTIAQEHFHESECSQLRSLPRSEQQCNLFFRYWVSKEAYLKGLGVGLAQPLGSFALRDLREFIEPVPQLDEQDWRMLAFDLERDERHYAVAVAAPGIWHVRQLDWSVNIPK